MRLHDPWLLLLAVFIPWLLRRAGRRRPAALCYPHVGELLALGSGRRSRWRWIPPVLQGVALLLLVVALARPQLGKAAGRVYTEGIDIMLAVDVSGSMLAEDFTLNGHRANRLQAVKSVVREFLADRPGDRVGLVLFAARPYTQCPLTLDHGWLLQNLERARVGMIEDGTAIGSALATAVNRLEASKAKSKIVILLTDGENNAGKVTPLTAAEAAKTLGYHVYTIGAGTRGLAPYPVRGPLGNIVYRPIQVSIDEDALRRIATMTGGRYFRATDTKSLEKIYAEIDRLEKSPQEAKEYLEYEELYPWFAVSALLLLLGEVLLTQTWLKVLP